PAVSRSAAANPAARSSGFVWPRMRMQTLKRLKSMPQQQQKQQQQQQQQHEEEQQQQEEAADEKETATPQHMDTATTTMAGTPTEAAAAAAALLKALPVLRPLPPRQKPCSATPHTAAKGLECAGFAVDRERVASAALSRLQSCGPPKAAAAAAAAAPAAAAAATSAESSAGPPHLQQWLRVVCKLKTVVAVGEADDDPLLLQFLRYLQNGEVQYTEAVVLADEGGACD
ncbi:hypothetical protein, conserved, partial [Eimeria tenella]